MPSGNNQLPAENSLFVPVFKVNDSFYKINLSTLVNVDNLSDILVPLYDPTTTESNKYEKGSYCIHEKKLYKCIAENGTYGEWVESGNWTQIDILDLIYDGISANNQQEDEKYRRDLETLVSLFYDSTATYTAGDVAIHEVVESGVTKKKLKYYDGTDWNEFKLSSIFSRTTPGLVPAPATANQNASSFLSGMGDWNILTPVTNAQIDIMFAEGPVIGGREYKTVRIGNQEWLAENLDYAWSGLPIGGSNKGVESAAAWYYDNDSATYGLNGTYKCGLLYNWFAAKYLDDNKATLLPEGWHVPSISEFDTLKNSLGSNPGTKLKAKDNTVTSNWPSSWNGTDDYGFNAVPSGEIRGDFSGFGSWAYYWSINIFGSNAQRTYLVTNDTGMSTSTNYKYYSSSLRLVKTLT